MIQDLIDAALILDSLDATEKTAALDEILDAAISAGILEPPLREPIRANVLEREALGSTGIGNGVAVPHVKHRGIAAQSIVLARSREGIDYAAVDGRVVHTVFLIFAPEDAAERHLQVLRWVSGLARDSDFRRFVISAKDATEIRDLLHEMSADR